MAMFDGNKRIEGSRSNTALVKSGHMSPAGDWILDTRFLKPESIKGKSGNGASIWPGGVLFKYEYGGPGMEDVVIPKGRMVGVSTPVKDFVSKKYKTPMTLPGMALNNNTIGMVPYNLCKDQLQLDRFGGNKPSIITLDFVTLPYMPTYTPKTMDIDGMLQEEKELSIENKMPWGSVIGKVEVGDYVKSTASGRLCKWIKGTDGAEEIVGQVLDCDLNGVEWGWREWMLWDESAIKDDDNFINKSGVSHLPSDSGYPYDPQYTDGNNIYQHIHSNALHTPTGIPGLHDGSGNYAGFGKNDTEYTDIQIGEVPKDVADNTLMIFKARDFAGGDLKNLQEGVKVKIDGTEVEKDRVTVNAKRGEITIKLNASDANKAVTATYKAFHYGTNSYLDFKGVQGAMFILLKK